MISQEQLEMKFTLGTDTVEVIITAIQTLWKK
jgi:hypothetical protein